MCRRPYVLLAAVGIGAFATPALGCAGAEVEHLREENKELRSQRAEMESERDRLDAKVKELEETVAKLKQTADYHYQRGVDLVAASKFAEAKLELDAVVEKYPQSSLVPEARAQLRRIEPELARIGAEARAANAKRAEEEKYKPRTPEEACREWHEFRKGVRPKGTVTTWRVLVWDADKGFGDIVECRERVELHGVRKGAVDNDTVVVTGAFAGLSSMGFVMLNVQRLKNEGLIRPQPDSP
jgi:hypothetical protein